MDLCLFLAFVVEALRNVTPDILTEVVKYVLNAVKLMRRPSQQG